MNNATALTLNALQKAYDVLGGLHNTTRGNTTQVVRNLAIAAGFAHDAYPVPHTATPSSANNLSLLGISTVLLIVGLLGLAVITDLRARASHSDTSSKRQPPQGSGHV